MAMAEGFKAARRGVGKDLEPTQPRVRISLAIKERVVYQPIEPVDIWPRIYAPDEA